MATTATGAATARRLQGHPPGVASVLATATVLSQVAYPLVHGAARDRLTVATVVLFFATSASLAARVRGAGWAAAFVVTSAGMGFAAEAVGLHTGWPFGRYRYTHTLGAQLAGVPLVVPLAWSMMAYPALVVGRRIADGAAGVGAGALALATWDLFLDPQMVAAGHWVWSATGPALLGIPLSNDAGWLATSLVLMALLRRAAPPGPPRRAGESLAVALYLWTYASSVLAEGVFLHLPGAALAGGVGMGVVVGLLWARRARAC